MTAGWQQFDLPDWVSWVAQDRDGAWWGYSVEPLRNDNGWYENEAGRYIKLGKLAVDRWELSLTKVQ